MKKSLLFLVVFALLWGGVATVQAAIYSGNCGADGANVTWKLDTQTGVLEISGTGAMQDYASSSRAPWYNYSSYNRSYITSVTIDEGVTSIGNSAFYQCTALTSITIPESVTSIGNSAFSVCSNLTSVTIPENVTTIGSYAFSGCTGLASVTIPENVTTIGSYAFSGCTGLASVTIPESVTSIGNDAFSGCTGLASVTIPESVTSIGNDAFSGCSNLTSVTIPENVTSIGDEAFFGCSGLTSVTIGDGVTSIGDRAFRNCTSLTSVTIPDGITTIGSDAFDGCTGLKNLRMEDGTKTLVLSTSLFSTPFDNCPLDTVYLGRNMDFSYNWNNYNSPFKSKTNLVSLTIGSQVTTIGNSAFSGCSGLTSVTIPESVQTIGESAFYRCTGLTSVTIGNGVTTIGSSAFSGCSGLTSVTIPESVTSIGNYAFSGCTNLTEFKGKLASFDNRCLVINGTLVAFASSGLTEYSIPNEVKVIGGSAFSGCSGLTSVTIPESVQTIGESAFYRCTGLTSVTIGNGVTTIGSSAFSGCTGLASVTIGNGVTSIGGEAFYGCTSLTAVTIGNGVTTIGSSAFSGCSGLTSVTIPESVTSIGNDAFSGCSNLTEFKGKLASFDNRCLVINGTLVAFASSGLTEYSIPNEVKVIGDCAFSNCTGLASVTIGNDVTTIGSSAFDGCSGLTSVTIGDGVTVIGSSAFYNCTGLKKVYISDLAAWCRIDFKHIDSNPLYYAHLYLDNTPVTDLKIPDDVTEIYPYAFYGCTSLTSVTIGNGVTSIGGEAFYGCTSLTAVTIGNGVTTIDYHAFGGCTNLRTITALSATPPNIILYESWSAFDEDIYKYATVNCPKGTLHIYKNADGWKNFTYPTAEKVLKPKFINGTAGQTTYSCTLSYTRDIDYPVSKLCIPTEGKDYLIDTSKTTIPITVIDLEPQTEYKNIEFVIETVYGEKAAVSVTFTTDTVRFTTQPAINVSNTSATLTADIECDALTGAGFEWRRYDDPELVPSTFSETPIVDGKISGTLRNLSPEKYYKYRPFYRTAKGKYYYGAWLAFGTRDIYAYFEPTVSTRTGEVRGNTTTLSGYIVEGSDEIISQGFEYWAESPAGSTTAGEHKRVEGSGSLMNVTLTGLDYNTTYYYRAYATTAKKTTYGAIESFTTGENPNPSGIEETAAEDGFAVRLSGNPVRNGEIGVQVVGADGATWYRVISLHGAQIAQGVLSGTDEWQPVKIPAASTGHYLLQIIGSKGTKTLRIVVE